MEKDSPTATKATKTPKILCPEGFIVSPVATEPLFHASQSARFQAGHRRSGLSSCFVGFQRPPTGRAPDEDVRGKSNGVTPAEATVLHVIIANPDVSHGKLAETLLTKPPNMTKMLKRLEAEGFIDRLASAQDRRRAVLSLTPKARRLVLQYRGAAFAHEKMAFAAFSVAERKTLIRLVRRALTSLETRKGGAR
jgi:DNA-binding MarR family transcriptional regulator